MVDLVVIRGAGDRQGDDIVEALLSTTAAALNRGRNELDRRATGKDSLTYTVVFRTGILLGQLVEVDDILLGASFRAKVTAVRHIINQTSATTQLTLERLSRFIT